jgi:hypothetical protein
MTDGRGLSDTVRPFCYRKIIGMVVRIDRKQAFGQCGSAAIVTAHERCDACAASRTKS